jgi:heat-inducible transcription repressor HrcA
LITRPQRQQSQLQALRLVASGERLLVFLVEGGATASSLNLRLPCLAAAELASLERWVATQLDGGSIDWTSCRPT